jgi:DNA-entry nuclease
MAKKKKSQKSSRSAITLVVALLIITLGALGVQVPDALQELFGLPTHEQQTTTPSSAAKPTGTNPGPIENGPATFSAEELQNKSSGWITYHSLDQHKRATGADALLKPAMVNTGTTADPTIRPPGFISGKANHSRGHLIGRQLGGSGDDPRNLTTLYQNPVNTPYMTKYENQIRQALDQGETIRYRVTPIYEGDELLCKEILLEAKGLQQNTTVNFKVTILNQP